MRKVKSAGVAAGVLAAQLLVPSALAAPAEVYHGSFTSVSHVGCTTPLTTEPTVTGDWHISSPGGSSAVLTVNIFVDGRHHVAFGGKLARVDVAGADIAVQLGTLAGPLTVSVSGTSMSYTISPYNYGDLHCDVVTYHGVAR